MSTQSTVRDLIGHWPSRKALAEDINGEAGEVIVSTPQVHKWADNQSIPAKYHHLVVRAGFRRSFPVTAEALVLAHALPAAGPAQVIGPAEDAA